MNFSMVKVEKISQRFTPFGGISFVHDLFKRSGLCKLTDNELDIRSSTCGYTYSSLIGNWFNLFLCGGNCAEDIETHLHVTFVGDTG